MTLTENQQISLNDALTVVPRFIGDSSELIEFISGCNIAKSVLPDAAEENIAKSQSPNVNDKQVEDFNRNMNVLVANWFSQNLLEAIDVRMPVCVTFEEAIEHAVRIENRLHRRKNLRQDYNDNEQNNQRKNENEDYKESQNIKTTNNNIHPVNQINAYTPTRCQRCRFKGHIAKDCNVNLKKLKQRDKSLEEILSSNKEATIDYGQKVDSKSENIVAFSSVTSQESSLDLVDSKTIEYSAGEFDSISENTVAFSSVTSQESSLDLADPKTIEYSAGQFDSISENTVVFSSVNSQESDSIIVDLKETKYSIDPNNEEFDPGSENTVAFSSVLSQGLNSDLVDSEEMNYFIDIDNGKLSSRSENTVAFSSVNSQESDSGIEDEVAYSSIIPQEPVNTLRQRAHEVSVEPEDKGYLSITADKEVDLITENTVAFSSVNSQESDSGIEDEVAYSSIIPQEPVKNLRQGIFGVPVKSQEEEILSNIDDEEFYLKNENTVAFSSVTSQKSNLGLIEPNGTDHPTVSHGELFESESDSGIEDFNEQDQLTLQYYRRNDYLLRESSLCHYVVINR
ncbi:hypothetical protein KQX54_010012 [Cotesia glomerata]|uniref:CCHC-type domain-containing protein n=1 Tax=Cotesia glomerata TaxID=32391 RepID=A0AAV7HU25_COTGL|nr:hypothetical protein KQX54_010012 [Cotesia glomerata]